MTGIFCYSLPTSSITRGLLSTWVAKPWLWGSTCQRSSHKLLWTHQSNLTRVTHLTNHRFCPQTEGTATTKVTVWVMPSELAVAVVATQEASNRSIDGMTASASNSDLREMRAKRDFSGTKTARFLSKEAHALMATCLSKKTQTDITKALIAVSRKFTTSRGLITCNRTQELQNQDTMIKCKLESMGTEFYEI